MAREERGFTYKKRSQDDVKERANARGGNFDSIYKPQFKTYKVREGKNLIRVLPPTWADSRHYGYDIFVNYQIGADNQSYLSLSKMKNLKDPLAEARREAESEGNEELARALRPTQRILMWVIDRNAEEEGPQLWAAPFTFDKQLANISIDEDTRDVIYLDDPEEGCDLRFYKEGTGLKTKYDGSKMKLLKPGPIHEDEEQQQEWLSYIAENPVPSCLNFYDYEHIANVFNGQSKPKNTDDDDEAPRARTRTKPVEDEDEKPSRRAAKPVEDEDADGKPSRRARASLKEEAEAEEEPDEKPAGRNVITNDGSGESIRDRLRKRRAEASKRADPDED